MEKLKKVPQVSWVPGKYYAVHSRVLEHDYEWLVYMQQVPLYKYESLEMCKYIFTTAERFKKKCCSENGAVHTVYQNLGIQCR